MKKCLLGIGAFLVLVGCTNVNNDVDNNTLNVQIQIEDNSEEKLEIQDNYIVKVPESDIDEEEYLKAEQEFLNAEFDEPLGDDGIVDDERGAFLVDLWKLEDIQNPMQFRADLDAYLIYCFPDIDKRYDTYVLDASEKDNGSSYQFKVKVDNINPDGSNLIIKCKWKHGAATEHYTFISDITPEGTDIRIDKDGNIINYK